MVALPKKKSPPAKRATKHDWDAIRDHYVETPDNVTLKDLSEAYNVAYQMVRRRAADEHWSTLRAQFQTEYLNKRRNDRIEKLTKEADKFDDRSLNAANLGQNLIVGRLAQIAKLFEAQQHQFDDAVNRMKAGMAVDKSELYSAINYKEMGELAAALDRFQQVGRRALGTDIQKFEGELNVQGEITENVNVSVEMAKGDIDRLAQLFEAAERSGVGRLAIEDVEEAEWSEDDDADMEDAADTDPGDDEDEAEDPEHPHVESDGH